MQSFLFTSVSFAVIGCSGFKASSLAGGSFNSLSSGTSVVTATPVPTSTPVPAPTATPSPTPAATPTPTPAPAATATPTPASTPGPTPAPTPAPVASASGPVNVILDTDFGADIDDAAALGILHALADNGEANILAVMHSTSHTAADKAIDAIDTYYGRPNIPIGEYKGTFAPNAGGFYDAVGTSFPNDLDVSNVPSAVSLYRQILAAQPDQSVVIISIGFLLNLSDLLNSPADQYSALSGKDLVARKVHHVAMMGGSYPNGQEYNISGAGETNSQLATNSSINVMNNWPTDIYMSDAFIGGNIAAGSVLKNASTNDPVRAAWSAFFGGSFNDRNAWDETAVLLGVRGVVFNGTTYWNLSAPGWYEVDSTGSGTFHENTANAAGKHQLFIRFNQGVGFFTDLINNLLLQAPKN